MKAVDRRPDIVLILMDDLGWRDLSCYGSTFHETPNLDRLARGGMRFTDAYAACPVCSPTRASLMSGKYPARLGVTDWIDHGSYHPMRGRLIDAPYVKELPLTETSLATALREGGYATWHVGKWHLGTEATWPQRHGFDVNIGGGSIGSPRHGYFSPYRIPNLSDGPEGEYLTDRLTDEAVRLIEGRDRTRPYFLNLWHYAPHTPIQAPAPLVEKYRRKARDLGLDTVKALVEGEPFPTEQKKHLRVTRRVIQSDPVYAAMIENLDTNIGRLLEAVGRSGGADDTVVIFTSDNGGLATAEGSPTCNAPLAEGKGWMYDGGVREPLIVSWPGRVPAGGVCHEPVTTPDLYPTLLEAAGLPLRRRQHVDGVSLMPLLRGGEMRRGPLFWHYPHYGNQGGTPGTSVRDGDHKLIEFHEDGRTELYDLRHDPSETTDLSARSPEVRDRLHAALRRWREEVGGRMPEANPAWGSA